MCQTENKSGRVGKEIGTTPQNFNAKLKREVLLWQSLRI